MPESNKPKYLTKTVKFAGRNLVLYSLDGTTWSTRRDELQAIKERQESQPINLADIKDDEQELEVGEDSLAVSDDDEVQMCSSPADDDEEESACPPGASKAAAGKSGKQAGLASKRVQLSVRGAKGQRAGKASSPLAKPKVGARRAVERASHKSISKPKPPMKAKVKVNAKPARKTVSLQRVKRKAA